MSAEFGVLALCMALLVALVSSSVLCTPRSLYLQITAIPRLAAWLQALLISAAFGCLATARVLSDFSVENVADHSNRSLPLLYKIAGTWGNHEGSMLLWLMVMTWFAAVLARKTWDELTHKTLAIQSLLVVGVLLFILLTSNPFTRLFPPPTDGATLNPLLQDMGLAIHPPFLYLGYVGFSLVFSLSIAALLQGNAGREWAHRTHPWIMFSWSSLTLGIGLGSWWAYRELGWGGWWFWDPVENASLLPWLSGTALLHANVVLKKREQLASWVILLSIITFGLSLLGTFLVRSGALTSVHSFASDPTRGLFIMGYIVAVLGGGLLLFALRGHRITSSSIATAASREGMIIINNLFILCACATVLLGTTYPLLAEWWGGTLVSVGAPYFNATFIPLMIAPLLGAGLAPLMAWKKASLFQALRNAWPALGAMLAASLLVLALAHTHVAMGMLGFGLSGWLLVSSLQWVLRSTGKRDVWAVCLGHLGVAICMAGITGAGLWKEETSLSMLPGDTVSMAGYTLHYVKENEAHTGNHHSVEGVFELSSLEDRETIAYLSPEYRTYDISGITTSETAIYGHWLYDVYAVIGEQNPDQTRQVRLYYVPMIRFIWFGFIVMTLAGLIAIIQQRKYSS